MPTYKRICLLGGTGFAGQHLVCELTRRRYHTRVLTRRRERHRDLLVFPTVALVETDVHDAASLGEAMRGCDAAINLVGILNESGASGEAFEAVHTDLPRKIAEACKQNGIARLLHMSALNASPDAPSRYLKTKARGENAVHAASGDDLHVTSFRPSVIFGPDDGFFNRFALLLRLSPFAFPLACPRARFAPVFVGDVVQAFVGALEDKTTRGERYDLCGPRQYTLQELVEYTARVAGLRRRVIGLNDRLSRLQARLLERVPGKPFSLDNYLSLQIDSVCRSNGLAAFGIEPRSVESVVPIYVGQQSRAALYRRLRSSNRRG